jgi:hypothetical protein
LVLMTTDKPVALTGGTPKLTYLWLNYFSAVMSKPSFWTVTDLRLDMAQCRERQLRQALDRAHLTLLR